mgnify:CR=1 FL=1
MQVFGPHAQQSVAREVLIRISARHSDPKALEILGKELAPTATSMAPGITGGGEGRPRATPLIGYSSVLVKKSALQVSACIGSSNTSVTFDHNEQPSVELASNNVSTSSSITSSASSSRNNSNLSGIEIYVPLLTIAQGRSGDKGDIANIGIIARKPEYFEVIKRQLDSQVVHHYMRHLIQGKVSRYELPGTKSFNFVCTRSLGGGGLSSLAVDRQGKTYAQILLHCPVKVPIEWALPSASKL